MYYPFLFVFYLQSFFPWCRPMCYLYVLCFSCMVYLSAVWFILSFFVFLFMVLSVNNTVRGYLSIHLIFVCAQICLSHYCLSVFPFLSIISGEVHGQPDNYVCPSFLFDYVCPCVRLYLYVCVTVLFSVCWCHYLSVCLLSSCL